MPCPTPAHSPAAPRCKMQPNIPEITRFPFEEAQMQKSDDTTAAVLPKKPTALLPPPISTTTKLERITKQIVKNLPQIPKFKKSANSFPIVRRSTITGNSSAPTMPKLTSMEIFNPETDDLDSDSSEPSSPDSIDSVISAVKPTSKEDECETKSFDQPRNVVVTQCDDSADKDSVKLILRNQDSISDEPHYHLLNNDTNNHHHHHHHHYHQHHLNNNLANTNDQHINDDDEDLMCRQNLVDFAEKLSAQLLKELDGKSSELSNEITTTTVTYSNTISTNNINDSNDSSSHISDIIINNDKNTSSSCSSNSSNNATYLA